MKSQVPKALLVIVSCFALAGFGCRQPAPVKTTTTTNLVVWGLWENSDTMDPILRAFKDQTGISVEYKKIASIATYEKTLLEALASGRGPDVFVINNGWVDAHKDILSPAPATVINPAQLQNEFVDVVGTDVVRNNLIYALPTSVDTLALYVNTNIFNADGIAQMPKLWADFQNDVTTITKVSRLGTIDQSGAAIGTASNVNRAPDVLQLLMMQSGLPIVDTSHSDKRIDIANAQGERALTFYTEFANKSKQVYTWDSSQDYSIDAFAEGKTAMMFNYSYQIPTVRAKNPRLQFAIAPMPQIDDGSTGHPQATFASYWPYAVSASSKSPAAAWQFVRFLTSQKNADTVNKAEGIPPARRDSIAQYNADPIMVVFAQQSLKAVSWPRVDIDATDAIFTSMIDSVATGGASVSDVLKQGQDQLQRIISGNAQ
ncbi:MAG TPA: extracellular solute-binding protein [Candidatus Andersenbacteria bacterium]|nr:extracellular solute-binding protein [Candidatus Andersenbacteria bacterium]